MLSEEQLELQISKLKKQAEDIIYWHKVGSYFVPVIPILGDIGFIAIKKDALKKIGKVFELDPNFSEETFKINNNIDFFNILSVTGSIIGRIAESVVEIPIKQINFILDKCVKKYREKRNNLKNTYIQASNYFQS